MASGVGSLAWRGMPAASWNDGLTRATCSYVRTYMGPVDAILYECETMAQGRTNEWLWM